MTITQPTDPAPTDDIQHVQPPGDVWCDRLLLLIALLAGGFALSRNLADADLWGHVTFGMNVLATRELPTTAAHTFTAAGYRWINHENLSEITLATIALLAGGTGLLVMKCLLGLAVLGSMIWSARSRSVGAIATCIVIALVSVNLSPAWTLRPQLASYGFCTLMVLLLNAAFDPVGRQEKLRVGYLWAVVAVMFVWANSHGGFVAGYGLFALYMIGRGVQALTIYGRRALLGVWRLALITICGGLATMVNPYGPFLHGWLFESLMHPRPEITEWVALTLGDDKFWPFVAIAIVAAASFIGTRRRRDAVQITLLAVTAWQSIAHARHVPFFAILAGFWVPQHLESLFERIAALTRRKQPVAESPSIWMRAAMGGVCVVVAVVLVVRNKELQVDKTEFPVDAIAFMADNGLSGRLVVTYNWAQYALAALGPDTTVAFDGRFRTCYPQQVVDMHFDLIYGDSPRQRWRSPDSPPPDPGRVLQYGQPDLALIDRQQEPSVQFISRCPDWVLLYQDARAQVWGRRSRFDNPGRPEFLSPARRVIADVQPAGRALWPAFPATVNRPAYAQNDRG